MNVEVERTPEALNQRYCAVGPVIEKPFLPGDVLGIVTEMTKGQLPLR